MGQFGVRNYKRDGTGAIEETLTPNPNVDWRILSLKLHVGTDPLAEGDFIMQVKDPSQSRHNAVLVNQPMAGVADVVQHYEGFGITLLKDQTVNFTWDNADGDGWGLIVSYVED